MDETTKRGLRLSNGRRAAGHCWTLLTCLDTGLRAIAPFMPVLAEHLHRHLPLYPGCERNLEYPEVSVDILMMNLGWRDNLIEKEVQLVMDAVVAIRRLKKIFNVTAKHKPVVHLVCPIPIFKNYSENIQDLTACHQLNISSHIEADTLKNCVKDNIGESTIYMVIPDDLRKSIELDLPKMEMKKEKVLKDLHKMMKMVSGDTYGINATLEAQESHAKKIASLEEKIARINYIQSLSRQ
ncbi:hypothetical protein NQ317_001281 [Molorchus minor]|uniref:valine--tRNA ligase n=1 Tax=Molorchus minor TaxID=1323400 RepID=A0ABQ9ISC3_9CUCU|nr:hypothetical protein NQ317_001281 [Molorchus minor]